MPDSVTHYWFGRQILAALDDTVRGCIHEGIYERALQGPDPWSTSGFYGGSGKRYAGRSSVMHKEKTGQYLLALTDAAKEQELMFSVLAGNLCHYCLDRRMHPYIICKGGAYDGTPATYHLRSGHVRLERAIDSYVIRRCYGKKPWRFSIPKEILKLKQYPENLRVPLDKVLLRVYGWENGFSAWNRSLRDEAAFYGLMQDPVGIVRFLLRPVSRGRTDYSAYSYYRRDIRGVDYMNDSRKPWRHPFDPAVISTDSVADLMAQAQKDAVEMICAAWQVVYEGQALPLEQYYGNSNYSTGFDCEDPRNRQTPISEPLNYPGKYQCDRNERWRKHA